MVDPSNPTQLTNPTNPSNPTSPATNEKITGQALIINNSNNQVASADIKTNNVHQLNVDGKTFTIGSPNIIVGRFSDISSADLHTVISGTHLSHTKHGYVFDKKAKKEYYFYQSEKTPVGNTPKQGIINYQGSSVYACDTCNGEIIKGSSKFSADFANKKLTGNISNDKATHQLSADIKGNTFANHGTQGGVKVDGAFFGNHAEELGGVYLDTNGKFAGTFGAKK